MKKIMSKTKKVFLVVLILIAVLAIRGLIYIYFPIKVVKNIKLEETNQTISLNNEMNEIYVFWDCDRGWVMMGHDGYKFIGGASKYPEVSIYGKFPSDLSYNLYNSTIFILKGSYCNNMFKVESYDLYAYYDKDSTNKFGKYLTLSDLDANIFTFRIEYIGDSEN